MVRPARGAFALLLPLALIASPCFGQQAGSSDDVMARIRDEGLNHSQLMQTLSYLSDVIGPRLTGSPAARRANEWTRDRLASYGLTNTHLEAWGPFGRGWELERFSAQVTSPQDIPLIAYPKAWSPGLPTNFNAEVVYLDATDEAGLAKFKGTLRGKIVLSSVPRPVVLQFEPRATRYTDERLAAMAAAEPRAPGSPRPGSAGGPGARPGAQDRRALLAFSGAKARFLRDEGAALIIDPSTAGDAGTIFVQSASVPPAVPLPSVSGAAAAGTAPPGSAGARAIPGGAARRVGPWAKDAPKIVPQIVVAKEQYNRLARMIQQGQSLRMAVQLQVKFYDNDLMAYNTIGEIAGSDLKDQVVMLGAHMDSWQSGTGATDNGAGDAVCMEAVRILKTLNLQPRRTIRIALWTGEEEGLYGSSAYVAKHLGARQPSAAGTTGGFGANTGALVKGPEWDKVSAYYNLDNGSGKIRGIYLQGNEAARPIFQSWLEPFKDLGASTVTISNTGSTDHVGFDGVGVPGFQFIQDVLEYDTLTHHSNEDVYDHVSGEDLKQAAVIMAAFVYNTAMRDEMIPRKPTAE